MAHKTLKKKTILAIVRTDKIDEGVAKGISITQSVIRQKLTKKELTDAITFLYKRYGSVKDVCDALDWPQSRCACT